MLHLFNQKYSENSNNVIECISVSRDPSEMILICWFGA